MCDRGEPARKQRRLTDLWRGTVSVETDVKSPGATTSQSVSTTCSQAVSLSSTAETAGVCAAATACTNDIGLAVGKTLTDEERVKFINPWKPSVDTEYPSSERCGKTTVT